MASNNGKHWPLSAKGERVSTFPEAELPSLRQNADIASPAGNEPTLVFVICARDMHLLHLRLESGSLHSQSGCGAVQTRNYSAGFPQYAKDVLAFHALQSGIVVNAEGGPQL